MPRIRNVGGVRLQPFLYVPAVLNVVTTGNGMGTKNVFKWNHALGFVFSIQSFFWKGVVVVLYIVFQFGAFYSQKSKHRTPRLK